MDEGSASSDTGASYDSDEEETSSGDNNNNNSNERESVRTDDDGDNSSTTSLTSMEAQFSQAPSTSSSFLFHQLESNNNSQHTSNQNHKALNGLIPDNCNTESTASTSSSM
nr:IP13018p [Drosophila melanogaster]